MQFPPDSNNSTDENFGNGNFPIITEKRRSIPKMLSGRNGYVPPQAFFLHEAPPPVYPVGQERAWIPSNIRIPSKKNFFFIVLIVVGIVLAIPFIALKQSFPTSKATAVHLKPAPVHTATHTTVKVSPIIAPLGKTIFPSAGKIMTGVSSARDLNVIGTFEKDAGKNASMILFYQDWGASDGDQNFPTLWVSSVRNHGSLPMIVWQPWVSEVYPQGNNEPTYALKNIIAGRFDAYIKQWAKNAKAWSKPLFLDFAPEMNGNWNPWDEGLNGNKAGEFVQAWRHVHTIFTAVGASNVTWVWDPNVTYIGSTPLAELYPGDAYVDWTAMDGFNWGTSRKYTTWLPFSEVFGLTYSAILKITHKPMMIALLSSAEKGGNKAAWINDAYSVELPEHFPAIKAVVWFDQVTQQDWRIESSFAAQQAFAQAMQAPIYASNTYGGSYMGG